MSYPLSFEETVDALRDPGRPPHFLAMDQSASTHRRHMESFGVRIRDEEDFRTKAAAARVMLATTPDLGGEFGAAIVHDDFFALVDAERHSLHDRLASAGVLVIGKKLGLDRPTGLATEINTLAEEMRMLVERWGVHLVKTRTTVTFGKGGGDDAADQMIAVHRLAAENGKIAAVLEPEFIKDNPGTLQQNEELMTRVLARMLDGTDDIPHPFVIKTSFPAPGSQSREPIEPESCAAAWRRIVDNAGIPPDLLVVFLSGGHAPSTSRELLQAMAEVRNRTGSSFSRANVERPYQRTFPEGGGIDIAAGQEAILMEGLKNRLAMQGRYASSLESVEDIAKLRFIVSPESSLETA